MDKAIKVFIRKLPLEMAVKLNQHKVTETWKFKHLEKTMTTLYCEWRLALLNILLTLILIADKR